MRSKWSRPVRSSDARAPAPRVCSGQNSHHSLLATMTSSRRQPDGAEDLAEDHLRVARRDRARAGLVVVAGDLEEVDALSRACLQDREARVARDPLVGAPRPQREDRHLQARQSGRAMGSALMASVLSGPHRDEGGVARAGSTTLVSAPKVSPVARRACRRKSGTAGDGEQHGHAERDRARGRAAGDRARRPPCTRWPGRSWRRRRARARPRHRARRRRSSDCGRIDQRPTTCPTSAARRKSPSSSGVRTTSGKTTAKTSASAP